MKLNKFYKDLLHFFIPLALTGFLMAFSGTIVNAGLARMASPLILISAFSIAKSLMQFIISPQHMFRVAVTSLTKNPDDYLVVKRFCVKITLIVTITLVILAYTDLASLIFIHLLSVPIEITEPAVKLLKVLVIYPIGLYLKDFYQGTLIYFKKTPLITMGTFTRIITLLIIVFSIKKLSFISGTYLTGIIVLGGLFTEGISLKLNSIKHVHNFTKEIRSKSTLKDLSILSFYWPLLLTTFIKTLTMPIINAGLTKSAAPVESITTFAITWGLIQSLNSPLNLFHQVSITYYRDDDKKKNRQLLMFGLSMALFITCLLFLLYFTHLGTYFFHNIIGVNIDISYKAQKLLIMATFLPVITILREYNWGILMHKRVTKTLGIGKIINIITLLITLFTLLNVTNISPSVIALISISFAECIELISILIRNRGEKNV